MRTAALLRLLPLSLGALILPAACSSDSSLAPESDGAADVASDTGGERGQGQDGGADAAAEAQADLTPDLPPDLPPDGPPPVVCVPSSPGRAAICGRIHRAATLPLIADDARADGKGTLLIVPADCNPFAPRGDLAGCKKEPVALGSAVTIMGVDLSDPATEVEYRLVDVMPGDVHVLMLLLETPHPLEGGLRAGDAIALPAPKVSAVAAQVSQEDATLTAMAREIEVKVSLDPKLMLPGDGKGPLVVAAYDGPPGMSEPVGVAVVPMATLPATVSLVVMEEGTYPLTSILDDDDSSMGFTMPDMAMTAGDAVRFDGASATVAAGTVGAKATLLLDQLVP